jgi:small subunit ribosomal protein S18
MRNTTRRASKDVGRRVKKKPCALCRDHIVWVDYKDVSMLRKYMSDRGKIRSRRVTGNCAQHQRGIAMAIKTARELVLLPYTQRTVTERPGGRRGGGRDGRGPGERRGPRREDGEEGPSRAPESADGSESSEATLADVVEVKGADGGADRTEVAEEPAADLPADEET